MRSGVLIVDDNAPFRELARALLQAEGFEVVGEAADAVSALISARALRPRLVLLDVQLPGQDGFEVARQLAQEAEPPMVILVSSRAEWSYRKHLAHAPIRGFITKGDLSGAALASLIGD
ncbi:MAG: response regulator transcription factor [Dermatophilaceae bacterium]